MLQQQQQELSFLLFQFFWHHSFLDIIFWSSCTHKNRQTVKWRIAGFLYLGPGKAKETGDFELLPKRHLRGSCISQKKLIQVNFTPCLKSWLLTKEFCAYTRNLVLVFNYILPRTLKPQESTSKLKLHHLRVPGITNMLERKKSTFLIIHQIQQQQTSLSPKFLVVAYVSPIN